MKRIVLFAHYDRDGLIDDYVLRYLDGLREIAERILFVSDCELRDGQVARLADRAELIQAGRHGEYDFGSWKRAFAFLGDAIADWDEIVIANDSCYAPLHPFAGAFARMADAPCDFWSLTGTTELGALHLNSYFIVFRRRVAADPAFRAFWPAVTAKPDHDAVIAAYEIGLSRLLIERGFRLGSLLAIGPRVATSAPDYLSEILPRHGLPCVKVRLFRDNPDRVPHLARRLQEIDGRYPRALIDAHIRRLVGTDHPRHYDYRLPLVRRAYGLGGIFQIYARYKNPRRWKITVRLAGLPVFSASLPVRPR
jgi:lipopolysaccharide biosynthesis protein